MSSPEPSARSIIPILLPLNILRLPSTIPPLVPPVQTEANSMLKCWPRFGMVLLSSHFPSFFGFAFLSFYMEVFIYYSHSYDGETSGLSCLLPAYFSYCQVSNLLEGIIPFRPLLFLNSTHSPTSRFPLFSILHQILFISQSMLDGLNKPKPGLSIFPRLLPLSGTPLFSTSLPPCIVGWAQSFF